MGSTLSVPSYLKTPLSYLTGHGDTAEEWVETEATLVLRVSVPSLKKDDTVNVMMVECEGHVMKLKINGVIKRSGKNFTKLVNLPENGGLFYQACVIVQDGFVLVTIPKVEEV